MKYYKVGEVAKEADVLPSTIRYYTDLGIIKPVKETKGGHKLYDLEAINIVKKAQVLIKLGKSIEEVKNELSRKVKRILLVEDDVDAGSMLFEFLNGRFSNYEIKWVKDGFSAGRIIPEFLPDLVILDIMLPGVDGFSVCRMIKQDGLLVDAKVLAITGYDSKEVREKILASGADSYLPKPFDLGVFEIELKKLLLSK